VQDKNERGGTTIRKVGMAPIQRDGMEYEFDLFGQLDSDHTLIIEKSRCPALAGAVIARPDARLAATLADWLSGADPAPQTRQQATQRTQAQQDAVASQRSSAPAQRATHPQASAQATTQATTQAPDTDLPTWGALGAEASHLGLDASEWQTTITTMTGKARRTDPESGKLISISAQLTDDDKRTMLDWLAMRRQQFEDADAATPPLESLSYAGH
jgi:hypothetical protein